MNKYLLTTFLTIMVLSAKSENILLEAESFQNRGGWVVDQQSMNQMGSPYLLAHGLGVPVENAETTIQISKKGKYYVWVRTRDWVAPWKVEGAPGKFQLIFNNKPLETVFGTNGEMWSWQDGGSVTLSQGEHNVALHDLTGFEGRCDAILLTTDQQFVPTNEVKALSDFRRKTLGFNDEPQDIGNFDFVVVGGGTAGICAAISAARNGCRVALIQDRPVLGGNNSSEVRVGLSGLINQKPYTGLGNLVDEVGPVGFWNLWEAKHDSTNNRSKYIFDIIKKHPEKKIHNAGPKTNYEDEKKMYVIDNEKNIKLFLNNHVIYAEKKGTKIVSVTAKNILTGKEIKIRGRFFADCTGDGNLGFLAKADYRIGRESQSETGEKRAPEIPDMQMMGTSIQWYADDLKTPEAFPECPWAVKFTEITCRKLVRGDWNWETGMNHDPIKEIEYIRDYGLLVVYGNWSFLKNQSEKKNEYENYKLAWVAYIGGKRESRRLLGDVILTEQDILNKIPYPDASFTTTWGIDLHYPFRLNGFEGEPFLSRADIKKIEPYPVPYRCLYSRNIDNLFMAGRNISVTHVALGTVRVMRTTAMMGEVIGMSASICREKDTDPRGVYEKYFPELMKMMEVGVGKSTFH